MNMIEDAFANAEMVPVGEISQSADTRELVKSFVEMQAELSGATLSGVDPVHGGRRYANINDVLVALREPLAKHGLAVMQFPVSQGDGRVCMTSRLVHTSGQWLQTPAIHATVVDFRGQASSNLQSLGSAITYLRRYQLRPFLGVGDEDDDGAMASGKEAEAPMESGNPTVCPDCGKPLRLRKGKKGEFYGCSGYPNCKYTRDSQPSSESPGPVVPASEPAASDIGNPAIRGTDFGGASAVDAANDKERKKLRETLKKAGNAAGLDDAALSVWVKGLGRDTRTCSIEDINALLNLIPTVAMQYNDWIAITNILQQDGQDSSEIIRVLNPAANHFLLLSSADRDAALEQARLKASQGVPY